MTQIIAELTIKEQMSNLYAKAQVLLDKYEDLERDLKELKPGIEAFLSPCDLPVGTK